MTIFDYWREAEENGRVISRRIVFLAPLLVALVAFLAPTGASATVLCKTTATPCGASNHYPIGSWIEAELKSGTSITLETASELQPKITCAGANLIYQTETTGSALSTVSGPTLTWTNDECTWSTNRQADLILQEMGQFELHHISGTENATITVKEVQFWFRYTEGSGESSWCKIKTPAGGVDFGVLFGGPSPTIAVNASFPASFSCGTTVKISGEYDVTSPKPLYVEPA
jgi:hypothetical protein